ncbi:formate dehydrogenase subunit delta [Chromobacterium alkanivorans]|uniref:formate dehydrogenase subunit delta n=1 Tax=Chromobacterium alkanivorans TaxID=1071719 RepID=UPI00216A6AE8|nr:formate dehydrogenase subunit delta [Chromobacterium alkanivorans]MCS3806773.1 formate dehydrogenase subunit delta [Chromobacterium alkanivorans]MCS3821055.1 formate dehydrogenase subunit delta [Chromobacterium alkanivorans]MCS3876033.1 formate dehydrogenase subunit delta [Chromobacterium alkanivorans]
MRPQPLVKMANEIARFFENAQGDDAAAEVAQHLRRFWTPAMREGLLAHWRSAGAASGLAPLAARALACLEDPPGKAAR